MKAMILKEITSIKENEEPLDYVDLSEPVPKENEVRKNTAAPFPCGSGPRSCGQDCS
jgi:hypothetical protein